MKCFHYPTGKEAGATMTVEELKAALDGYPGDMPVFARWEDVDAFVRETYFFVQKTHKGDKREECSCLIMEVDDY